MKHRVDEIEGDLLDAAVTLALGLGVPKPGNGYFMESEVAKIFDIEGSYDWPDGDYQPSQKWAHAGSLIERERIGIAWNGEEWVAEVGEKAFDEWRAGDDPPSGAGDTPLIAAMRAFVRTKFGDEVELP
ncbi:MAG: phage protein NinX family protein [Bacteroidota bacterium]